MLCVSTFGCNCSLTLIEDEVEAIEDKERRVGVIDVGETTNIYCITAGETDRETER